ncbi:glycosyltransferase family 2 protein [bacterium AH-315-G11]|nr:glycosyltransferase family 2 protein [bacterium AH-315-G11]
MDRIKKTTENISPESVVDISVILVSYNTEYLIFQAMTALYGAVGTLNVQVIFVDNASRDDSVTVIKEQYPECELIENEKNVGFGRANNQAVPLIKGRYVLLLNTDAFVSPDTLEKTVAYMDEYEKCGLLGVKLIGRDGALQPSCRYFPTPFNIFLQQTGFKKFFPATRMVDDMDWGHDSPKSCDWVPGCYLLMRKEVIDQVGLFDERYFLYSEEVDLCFAAKKADWQVHYFSDTSVIHLGGESAKSDGEITESGGQLESLQIESELLYFRKNHGFFGVLSHVVLQLMTSAILLVKSLLKGKGRGASWKRSKEICLLFWKTRWGTQPTR